MRMTKHGALVPFLLGILTTKILIDYRKKRISLNFPITKAPIAEKFVEAFGGHSYSIFSGRGEKRTEYVRWDIQSRASLVKLQQVVHHYKDILPEAACLKDIDEYLITTIKSIKIIATPKSSDKSPHRLLSADPDSLEPEVKIS